MLKAVSAIVLALVGGATGFAVHDFTQLRFDPDAAIAPGYLMRAEPERMTLVCSQCAGSPMIDVRLGRQDDGTEARVRAGATTMAQLEAQCQARDPACRIEAVKVAPAVGWLSSYRFGEQYAHTLVVLRDGDLLTVRSLASDRQAARRNADVLLEKLVPRVVGK
jgi:hypothetical protein